jgi:small-conductance mechanosensitive channel
MANFLPAVDPTLLFDILKSLLLLGVVLAFRTVLVRSIAKNPHLTLEAKRRWVVAIRNTAALGFLTGLAFMWLNELQTFAVSIVAIAAALVLATKELILCWSGAALRVGGKVYSVGDRIQIGGYRGVVLDHDAFATRLLEIGPGLTSHLYTGRIVVFPNSLLFTNGLVKENPPQDHGLYVIHVPVKSEENWQAAEQALLNAAKAECAPFMEEVSRQMKLLEQRNLLEAPSPDPRVTIQLIEPGRVDLILRYPAPDRGRSRVEQAILRRYLRAMCGPSQ